MDSVIAIQRLFVPSARNRAALLDAVLITLTHAKCPLLRPQQPAPLPRSKQAAAPLLCKHPPVAKEALKSASMLSINLARRHRRHRRRRSVSHLHLHHQVVVQIIMNSAISGHQSVNAAQTQHTWGSLASKHANFVKMLTQITSDTLVT